ncbi:hypothetical protein Pcac1_g1876 [Phytophthora cactorum]|uniref:Uncharacterized protein n=1 Tax=Phytophthora cactorum TaxID=29920 RepID=A0A329RXJ0_9STRA|nr:hypothetical protein Pcac1_g1876 [Phytophthora cactorum]KAG2862230.1 hypothetical protein PC113_g6515 [Phytophthora cactorum]RAW28286.1 hypothetical protein PC110_g15330 [Phytophthora cactorum]
MRAALLLANDMAKNNFVSTRGSDGSTPTMRYNSQNSRTTKSAEMVAAGQTTVDVVVATWIKSAGAYLYSDLSSSASTTSTTAPSCASTTGCWTWPTRPVRYAGREVKARLKPKATKGANKNDFFVLQAYMPACGSLCVGNTK